MEEEEWRNVLGYEGKYEVSSIGRVRSLDRIVHDSIGRTTKYFGKILKQFTTDGDYLYVSLWGGKTKQHQFRVNRLVAQAFIPNPDNLPQVNHKDCIKQNNMACNLEWCTAKQNTDHAILNKRRETKRGQDHYASKLNNNDVSAIRQLKLDGVKQMDIAVMFNCSQSVISNVVNKKTWII